MRQKLGRMRDAIRQKKQTLAEDDEKAVHAGVEKAESAFEKGDYPAVVAGCDEALSILNKFLEQHGK